MTSVSPNETQLGTEVMNHRGAEDTELRKLRIVRVPGKIINLVTSVATIRGLIADRPPP